MAIQLYTARAGFSHCPEEHAFLAADWPMPRDERSETRFRVYKDLRSKGFYLTTAGKFGGDYLVYPGEIIMDEYIFTRSCSPVIKYCSNMVFRAITQLSDLLIDHYWIIIVLFSFSYR